MQYNTQGGINYISSMTWQEKEQLCSFLKPIKTYDYVYFIPTDLCTLVYALKDNSILTSFHIPVQLPGQLCIALGPFINLSNSSIFKLCGSKVGFDCLDFDIEFPTLDGCLSTYLPVNQKDQYLIKDEGNIVYTPSYYMINKFTQSMIAYEIYKQTGSMMPNYTIINCSEDVVNTVVEELRSMKADDGAKLGKILNKYIITLYAGMIPLNKSDRLEMTIYDNPMSATFIVEYKVYKGKSTEPIKIQMMLIRL